MPTSLQRQLNSIRLQFPGYESSTGVKEKLEKQNKIDGRETARSMQVRKGCPKSKIASLLTYPVKRTRGKVATKTLRKAPVTKGKLFEELSKRIAWYASDLESNRDVSQSPLE